MILGYKADPEEVDVGQKARKSRKDGPKEKTELKPDELKRHFRKLWETDSDLLLSLFPMFNIKSKYPTDLFFVDVLSVPPPKSRPCQYTGGMMTIHPQSTGLQNVVESITVLKQILQVRKFLTLYFQIARKHVGAFNHPRLQSFMFSS